MNLNVYVQDTLYNDAVLIKSISVSADISDRMSTATMSFRIHGNAFYDEALYDEARYGTDVRELYEIRVEDADTGDRKFAGQIAHLTYDRKKKGYVEIQCRCSDYTWILERTIVPSASFTNASDRQIIQTLINTYAPELSALTANIAALIVVSTYEVKDKSLRQVIEELAEMSGAEWRVDYYKAVHYFHATSIPAPFGLSSQPNGTTTKPILAASPMQRDAIRIINSCTVIGGLVAGTTAIRQTYSDPNSIALYGVRSHPIIDREIRSASDALLRAQAVVQQHAYPQTSITLSTYADGLSVGQSLSVFHEDYQLNEDLVIRSLQINQETKERTRYTLQLGAKQPDSARVLRALEARTRHDTRTPQAIPALQSITDDHIAIGGLSGEVIRDIRADTITIGQITHSQIQSVNAATITVGQIAHTQIGSINAATVNVGQLVHTQIGSVNASTITVGVIISNQVADGLIDRLAMYAAPLRAIPRFASDPALPDPNYPTGSYYMRTSDGVFRRNDGGVWNTVTESQAVAGKLEYFNLGTIKAGSIIGLIAAGQIDSITAGQITGTISAAQITSVNASAIVGQVTAAQIASVNATVIQGTISAAQIGSVNAGSITGTISHTQIGSINAGTITIGLIGDSQLGSMSASKLTAGTIDASVISVVNLNAANITAGTMSVARLAAGTMNIGAGNTLQISGTGILMSAATAVSIGGSFYGGNQMSCDTGSHILEVGASGIDLFGTIRYNGNTGATGSFTTTDGKTVTVSGGGVVSIV